MERQETRPGLVVLGPEDYCELYRVCRSLGGHRGTQSAFTSTGNSTFFVKEFCTVRSPGVRSSPRLPTGEAPSSLPSAG